MTVDWARLQGEGHGAGHDYTVAPHLRHPALFAALSGLVAEQLADAAARGLPTTVLEVGAGHGAFTERLLGSGYDVTATEMSEASAAFLRERFAGDPRFRVVLDRDGSLASVGAERYAVVLYASVVHHIPDYVAALRSAVDRHLLPGGNLVTLQDPLWYPSVPRAARVFERVAFYSWRLLQGEYRRGFSTLLRRVRGVYDDTNPSDVVEYHVVRKGVDQQAIIELLRPRFREVRLVRYWSTPMGLWQRLGHRIGVRNTFAIAARNAVGPDSAGG